MARVLPASKKSQPGQTVFCNACDCVGCLVVAPSSPLKGCDIDRHEGCTPDSPYRFPKILLTPVPVVIMKRSPVHCACTPLSPLNQAITSDKVFLCAFVAKSIGCVYVVHMRTNPVS